MILSDVIAPFWQLKVNAFDKPYIDDGCHYDEDPPTRRLYDTQNAQHEQQDDPYYCFYSAVTHSSLCDSAMILTPADFVHCVCNAGKFISFAEAS